MIYAFADRLLERFGISDNVIRRQHQQQRVTGGGNRLQCCQRQCRCGIAASGLKHNGRAGNVPLAQLLGDHKPVLLIADNQRCGKVRQAGEPLDGIHNQRLVAGEGLKLFRKAFAGQRPQAAADATGENDWGDLHAQSK